MTYRQEVLTEWRRRKVVAHVMKDSTFFQVGANKSLHIPAFSALSILELCILSLVGCKDGKNFGKLLYRNFYRTAQHKKVQVVLFILLHVVPLITRDNHLHYLEHSRYLSPRCRRIKHKGYFAFMMSVAPEEEFKREYRMDRDTFSRLVDTVERYAGPLCRQKMQRSVRKQVAIALKTLGCCGNGASDRAVGSVYGVGAGTVRCYRRRLVKALLNMKKDVLFWPTEQERGEIGAVIERLYNFPLCVGFVDGTLFPLSSKPKEYAEDYYCRKGHYAITGVAVCDHSRKIRYMNIGWPGAVHDARVWRNASLHHRKGVCSLTFCHTSTLTPTHPHTHTRVHSHSHSHTHTHIHTHALSLPLSLTD